MPSTIFSRRRFRRYDITPDAMMLFAAPAASDFAIISAVFSIH